MKNKNHRKELAKQGMSKSIPSCTRTFKSWLWEVRMLARKSGADLSNPNLEQLRLYHNGGYSPKVVISIELGIPI